MITILQRNVFRSRLIQHFRTKTENMSKDCSTGTFSMAYVNIPDMPLAKQLAKKMFEKNLVAAVNMIPGVQSMFHWDGSDVTTDEVLMIIKTRSSKLTELCELVKSEHPYKCPCFVATKIDQGNPAYLRWIADTVPE